MARHDDRAPESALEGYLADAIALLDSLPDPYAGGQQPEHVADERLSEDFDPRYRSGMVRKKEGR